MKNILYTIILSFLFSSNAIAAKLSLKDCKKVSEGINKRMPMRVNKNSIAQNTYCTLEGGTVIFNYNYLEEPGYINWNEHKQRQINTWCSRSDLRELLDITGKIAMHYHSMEGVHIKTIIFSNRYC